MRNGKIIFVANAEDNREEIFVGLKKAILMGIEVRGFHAHGEGAGQLRADFCFDVFGIDVRSDDQS